MSVPSEDQFFEPIINELKKAKGRLPHKELVAAIRGNAFSYFPGISKSDLEERDGQQRRFDHHIASAEQRLKKLGTIVHEDKRGGFWSLVSEWPPTEERKRIPQEEEATFQQSGSQQEPAVEETVGLEKLVAQQKAQAKEALKKQLQSMSATGFEHFVGRLLETMGFVDVVVTQRSYDGGIDGHCKHPVLDMDVVFQAKKWANNVGGDPVAAFRGRVMARYGRGFFITTSSFTPGAREMAEEAGGAKVILIDGEKLTDLMIEKGLGVEEKPLTYWQVKEDFFSQFK